MSSGPLWIKKYLSCAQDEVAAPTPADDTPICATLHPSINGPTLAPATKPHGRRRAALPWGLHQPRHPTGRIAFYG